jgi:ABC-2 type transport system ATP-binding protein
VIELQKLSFSYRKQKLFTDLNLRLAPGHIHGLLGKNGVGKTTLLKLISGLRYPQAGSSRVWGFEPRRRMPGMLEELYLIPEEFSVPAMPIKNYENIHSSFYPRFDGGALDAYVKEFDLDLDKKLTELSYGQKKKFLLAFGLATNCRLLLLDEPTNGLDIPSKSQFRRVLASAVTDDRIIIVSTHQVRDMENLIDNIIILEKGTIVFHRDVHDISTHLAFLNEHELPEGEDVVYAEKVLGGHMVVRPNTSGEESHIELETLFNAVIADRDRINGLFPGGAS